MPKKGQGPGENLFQFAASELFVGQDARNHPNQLSVSLDFEWIEMGVPGFEPRAAGFFLTPVTGV